MTHLEADLLDLVSADDEGEGVLLEEVLQGLAGEEVRRAPPRVEVVPRRLTLLLLLRGELLHTGGRENIRTFVYCGVSSSEVGESETKSFSK